MAHPVDVTVDPTFDGDDVTTIGENILLPAAGSHTYTVRAVVDAGEVQGSDDEGNCTIEPAEDGTGFRNIAVLETGLAAIEAEAEACAQVWDPGVTRLNGVPTQQADGSWLLSYTMTVSNPSTVQVLLYGLVDELEFPADTEVTIVSAASRAGGPVVEADWNGGTQRVLVADGAPLPPNAIHVFDVTVRALLPQDQESQTNGWSNLALVRSGVDGIVDAAAFAEADILIPKLEIVKTATSDPVPRIGDTVRYEVTLENVGEGDFTALYPAVVWDDLVDVVDDGVLSNLAATPDVGSFDPSGPTAYRWAAPLLAGGTVTLQRIR